ncbi:hypothetical protein L914_19123 [Phytophthora nicotianae]|uniref:Uncharacterized protein n=1 Tax=Phytophthora nicotianae TaxID=4792 RepID=W2MBI9_PHYNI|nr:hypothetical protein L914_19123 [Phytophthora nicotianae]
MPPLLLRRVPLHRLTATGLEHGVCRKIQLAIERLTSWTFVLVTTTEMSSRIRVGLNAPWTTLWSAAWSVFDKMTTVELKWPAKSPRSPLPSLEVLHLVCLVLWK